MNPAKKKPTFTLVKRPSPRVALLIESSSALGRDFLLGISEYLRAHTHWSIEFHEMDLRADAPDWFNGWQGDGVIARVKSRSVAKTIARLGVPTVDLFGGAPDVKIPLVCSNEENVGRVAAQHLLERGFRFFAFCGRTGLNWSDARANGFRQCVTEAGFPFQMFSSEGKDDVAENIVSPKSGDDDVRGLKDWLDSLPKPVGIMTCNDVRGRAVIQACSELGLAVPDDVAVIGVDKDDVMSALAEVPLSSVIVNSQRIGYEAAALLDRMMNGERPPREAILIDPIGVATRRSTDIISVTDPNLAKAMLFIQKNCCETITINSVAAFAGLSRSVLQRRFRSILRETVHEAIIRLRLKRARELLLGTNLPLLDVADSSGFKSGEYMGVVFKTRFGKTPAQFRKELRTMGASASGGLPDCRDGRPPENPWFEKMHPMTPRREREGLDLTGEFDGARRLLPAAAVA